MADQCNLLPNDAHSALFVDPTLDSIEASGEALYPPPLIFGYAPPASGVVPASACESFELHCARNAKTNNVIGGWEGGDHCRASPPLDAWTSSQDASRDSVTSRFRAPPLPLPPCTRPSSVPPQMWGEEEGGGAVTNASHRGRPAHPTSTTPPPLPLPSSPDMVTEGGGSQHCELPPPSSASPTRCGAATPAAPPGAPPPLPAVTDSDPFALSVPLMLDVQQNVSTCIRSYTPMYEVLDNIGAVSRNRKAFTSWLLDMKRHLQVPKKRLGHILERIQTLRRMPPHQRPIRRLAELEEIVERAMGEPTVVCMNSGSFYFPEPEDERNFLQLYAGALSVGAHMWTVERTTNVVRMFMDLDFMQLGAVPPHTMIAVASIVQRVMRRMFSQRFDVRDLPSVALETGAAAPPASATPPPRVQNPPTNEEEGVRAVENLPLSAYLRCMVCTCDYQDKGAVPTNVVSSAARAREAVAAASSSSSSSSSGGGGEERRGMEATSGDATCTSSMRHYAATSEVIAAAPSPVAPPSSAAIASARFVKSGCHMIWPNLYIDGNMAADIRANVILELTRVFGARRPELGQNSWYDVVDHRVYGDMVTQKKGCGLRMLGARKVDKCPVCDGGQNPPPRMSSISTKRPRTTAATVGGECGGGGSSSSSSSSNALGKAVGTRVTDMCGDASTAKSVSAVVDADLMDAVLQDEMNMSTAGGGDGSGGGSGDGESGKGGRKPLRIVTGHACNKCRDMGRVDVGRPYMPMCVLDGWGRRDLRAEVAYKENLHLIILDSKMRTPFHRTLPNSGYSLPSDGVTAQTLPRDPLAMVTGGGGSGGDTTSVASKLKAGTARAVSAATARGGGGSASKGGDKANDKIRVVVVQTDARWRVIEKLIHTCFGGVYARVVVTDVNTDAQCTVYMVNVMGPQFCHNAGRTHTRNRIYFKITAVGVVQRCYSESVSARGESCRTYGTAPQSLVDTVAAALFTVPHDIAREAALREAALNDSSAEGGGGGRWAAASRRRGGASSSTAARAQPLRTTGAYVSSAAVDADEAALRQLLEGWDDETGEVVGGNATSTSSLPPPSAALPRGLPDVATVAQNAAMSAAAELENSLACMKTLQSAGGVHRLRTGGVAVLTTAAADRLSKACDVAVATISAVSGMLSFPVGGAGGSRGGSDATCPAASRSADASHASLSALLLRASQTPSPSHHAAPAGLVSPTCATGAGGGGVLMDKRMQDLLLAADKLSRSAYGVDYSCTLDTGSSCSLSTSSTVRGAPGRTSTSMLPTYMRVDPCSVGPREVDALIAVGLLPPTSTVADGATSGGGGGPPAPAFSSSSTSNRTTTSVRPTVTTASGTPNYVRSDTRAPQPSSLPSCGTPSWFINETTPAATPDMSQADRRQVMFTYLDAVAAAACVLPPRRAAMVLSREQGAREMDAPRRSPLADILGEADMFLGRSR